MSYIGSSIRFINKLIAKVMSSKKTSNDYRSVVKNPTSKAYIADQKKQICQLQRKLAKGQHTEYRFILLNLNL